MAEGIQIKNLPSTTTIKQGDTMTIVQDKQNKQLSLDVFANESDLATLSVLENRCDEVKAKIEVDEYSAEITTSQSMSEIGSDDNGVNLHENVLDGAYESCVLKGKTKYIDNDTQEILDTFQDGRNLSLIDVKSPILLNCGKNLYPVTYLTDNTYVDKIRLKANTRYTLKNSVAFSPQNRFKFRVYDLKQNPLNDSQLVEIHKDLYYNSASVAFCNNGNKDYIECSFTPKIDCYISITSFNSGVDSNRDYHIQLEEGSTVTTYEPYKSNILSCETYFDETTQSDKTIVLRSLPDGTCDTLNVETGEYVQKIGERNYQNGDTNSNTLVTDGTKTQYKLPSPITTKVDVQGFPHAYKNGHIQLSSGSNEPSLTPTVTYKVPVSRVGQIASNTKSNLRQTIKLDQLEILAYQSLINAEYENLLVQNSAESAASFTDLSTNDPKDELYYMLKHLIEEDQPVQNMLDKINLFYLYGLLSDEHYFDLLLGGEEDVY